MGVGTPREFWKGRQKAAPRLRGFKLSDEISFRLILVAG
jgi:hypothetical protein